MDQSSTQSPSQADRIIDKFGGLTPLARALGHKHVSTVQGWKESGTIPPRWHQRIFNAAKELGIELVAADFVAVVGLAGDEAAA